MAPVIPDWADIQPKVTAAALAYAGATVVMSVLEHEAGLEISATTSTGASGFAMLLFAYLMPNGRHAPAKHRDADADGVADVTQG
ncbi:hypothetical protein ACI3EY_16535 [Ornithinimicrobium sp. LYQ92]|uniref:hypothetical protein n=1 Tax=Serinicoccus sp. LYQ92 TaxID=3378798 RepID=UPI0038555188